jgi:hypothetical protein
VRGLVIVLIAGCGAGGGGPDADPYDDPDGEWDGTYSIRVHAMLRGEPTVRIDGVLTDWYDTSVAGEAAAAGLFIDVENLVAGQVASAVSAPVDCDERCGPAVWSFVVASYCAYDSGELRLAGIGCSGSSSCEGDAGCDPPCAVPDLGCPGEKCGLKRLPFDISRGWLQCVPAGPVGRFEACLVDADGVDDCKAGLHCVDGTCRTACDGYPPEGECAAGTTCTQVAGASPGATACLPD